MVGTARLRRAEAERLARLAASASNRNVPGAERVKPADPALRLPLSWNGRTSFSHHTSWTSSCDRQGASRLLRPIQTPGPPTDPARTRRSFTDQHRGRPRARPGVSPKPLLNESPSLATGRCVSARDSMPCDPAPQACKASARQDLSSQTFIVDLVIHSVANPLFLAVGRASTIRNCCIATRLPAHHDAKTAIFTRSVVPVAKS